MNAATKNRLLLSSNPSENSPRNFSVNEDQNIYGTSDRENVKYVKYFRYHRMPSQGQASKACSPKT